jgi:hypothetical protein
MKAKPKPKAKGKVKVADLKTAKKTGQDKLKNVRGGAYTSLVAAKTTIKRPTAADNDYTWVSGFCC